MLTEGVERKSALKASVDSLTHLVSFSGCYLSVESFSLCS